MVSMMKNLFPAMLGAALAVSAACSDDDVSADLPDGFGDAREVPLALGNGDGGVLACDGAVDERPATLNVAARDGDLHVAYSGCFGCEYEKYKAYVRKDGDGYEVLFSAAHIEHHNACGWGVYTARLVAGPGSAGDPVSVFLDWSGEAKRMAEAVAAAEPVDCAGLEACDAETPCENEGMKMDERADDYTWQCTSLDACGGAFCIWDQEACMLACGALGCGFQESYPVTPACGS